MPIEGEINGNLKFTSGEWRRNYDAVTPASAADITALNVEQDMQDALRHPSTPTDAS